MLPTENSPLVASSSGSTAYTNGSHHRATHDEEPPPHAPSQSFLRRSIRTVADLFHPFSAGALSTLPKLSRPLRYTRRDAVPELEPDSQGNLPTVRDYHAITHVPPQVRVPKKVPTPVKVEPKVWFANERTWVSWLSNAVTLASLSVALYNASKDDIARRFAYVYALISISVLVGSFSVSARISSALTWLLQIYAYALYQYRVTMILRRDPGYFDARIGPIVISIALFVAILANFIFRVRELHKNGTPFPGTSFFFSDPSPAPPSLVIQNP